MTSPHLTLVQGTAMASKPVTGSPPHTRLKSGGGGGTFDGMEPRVASLEAKMDITRADISALRTDVGALRTDVNKLAVDMATIKENVRHLPGKGFVVTVTLLTLTAITALTLFQAKIQAFIGIAK